MNEIINFLNVNFKSFLCTLSCKGKFSIKTRKLTPETKYDSLRSRHKTLYAKDQKLNILK